MNSYPNRSLLVCAVLCVLAFDAKAAVVGVVLSPVSDGAGTDQPYNGVFDSFFLSNSVYLVGGSASAEYRSVLEFSLSGIPAGATITSATLQLHTVASLSSGGSSVDVSTRLFAGNGIAEITDLTANGSQRGPINATLGDNPQFDFTPALQSLFSSGAPYAGFTVLGFSPNYILEFGSRNYSNIGSRPTLTLAYTVPEPAALSLLVIGAVGLLFMRRCASS